MIAAVSAFLTLDLEQFYWKQFNINLQYSLLLHWQFARLLMVHTIYVRKELLKGKLIFKAITISSPLCNICEQQLLLQIASQYFLEVEKLMQEKEEARRCRSSTL